MTQTKSLILYYFTGTGNSYRVAEWMLETAQKMGIAAQAKPIEMANPAEDMLDEGQMFGLVCPTHAFSAPWSMIRFAMRLPDGRLPKGEQRPAFSLMTRGGLKFGQVYVPGLEGSGAYLLALILRLKGYRVVGAGGFDMPVNWTMLVPSQKREPVEAIIARSKTKVSEFIKLLFAGETNFRGFIELAIGIALLPVTLAYLVIGRFFLAKLNYASAACDGCGVCARSCPVQAIQMLGKGKGRPYWTFLCESCGRCINYCPKQAVEASYPFGALLVYISSIPVVAFLLDLLGHWVARAAGWKGTLVESVIYYPYMLLTIALAYLVFSLALRVPLVNRLLTVATPTHYYRRYHEPETKLRDMSRKG